MNIRKIATITVLVFSSFAATNVAPTKAELEAMYDKAFREFNANNFPQALKELDAIEARQPDLAESQNLRGVILMRQAQYDQAEVALQKALATDPKFWNARFNLAEIPFLRKDWSEARKRFDALLQGNAAELQGEAAQLIQYKILLTYLLQGNENMVDSILAKFELSPDTPAASYSHAAIALQHKNQKEATDLLASAEKNFSQQLNKLFAESLYEVGWLQKPVGQTRAALELTSAADRAAKAKSLAAEKYERAEQAFQQLDLTAARKLVEEADAADPNQAATINLSGEILLAQKDFEGAEIAFKRALKLDPKLHEAQFNLAEIPFKKKEYSKARDRLEALFGATPAAGDKNQATQIIKFKIYLTLLLEGKDSRAQKMMEQFQFTGDTPALYYAQSAWEFKHNNTAKANLWIVSARKIYSPALNLVFADSFYDLGWLQRQPAAPATGSTEVAKTEVPSIEPSPIPAAALVSNKPATQPAESPTSKSPATVVGTDTTTKNAAPSPSTSEALVAKNEKTATAPDASPKVEMPVASNNALPSESRAPIPREQNPATVPAKPAVVAPQSQAKAPPAASAASNAARPAVSGAGTPATVLAPKTVREWSQPSFVERMDRLTNSHALLVGTLLLAATVLLAWVVISELRRRVHGGSVYQTPAPAVGPRFDAVERGTTAEKVAARTRLAGGPPQISLQLKATEPSVRRAAVPLGKMNRPFGAGGATAAPGTGAVVESFVPREMARMHEPEPFNAPLLASADGPLASDVPPVHDLLSSPVAEVSTLAASPEWDFAPVRTDIAPSHGEMASIPQETPVLAEEASVFEAPAAFEARAAIEAPAGFEKSVPVEDVSEPATLEMASAFASPPAMEAPAGFEEPVPVEDVSEPATLEMASAFVSPPAIEAPAGFEESVPVEDVSEPATLEMASAFVSPPAIEAPAGFEESVPVEDVSEPAALETTSAFVSPPAMEAPAGFEESVPVEEISEPATLEATAFDTTVSEPISMPSETIAESVAAQPVEISETEIEPVAQGQPIPYQVPAFSTDSNMAETTKPEPESLATGLSRGEIAAVGGLRPSVETPFFAPQIISTEPLAQQPTKPAIMLQSTQPTSAPIRTAPMTGAAPQPASGMQTAVQLTFSFEIASLQLTPSFKMGALQLKPTSKIVTMRLAPSQQPQPAMNLQVTFEISSVQLAGNALGMIRLTPSQQQRPGVISSPAFSIAGLQLLSGADSGAVQLTPSQQGQASVHVTGRFQIATIEFSPSFEIASILLNSTSKDVSVQLPGAGPSAVEGAPVFEITSVQLAGNGEIGMMHLHAQGTPPKQA